MPSRLARSRCDRRSTSAGGSREPSERAMAASVAPSAGRHLRRPVAVRAARRRPGRRPTARIVKPPRRGPRLAPWPNAARIRAWLEGPRAGLRAALAPPGTPPRESWWRRMLPGGKKTTPAVATASTAAVPSASAPAPIDRKDITGVWRGRWAANGAWGERRESDAQMIFAQLGTKGTARMVLTDTVAATGVPEVVRHFGALGTPMNIRVSRSEVVARFEDGPAVLVRFKREGDRLYGPIDASPALLLVLEPQLA